MHNINQSYNIKSSVRVGILVSQLRQTKPVLEDCRDAINDGFLIARKNTLKYFSFLRQFAKTE